MGMNQIPIIPSRTTVVRSVRARIYRANRHTAENIHVYYREDTRHPERGRYLMASDELCGLKQQPYIHDTIVRLKHRRKDYTFRIFYKKHKLLPANLGIQALAGVGMEGDVLVVACGKKVGIRNLSSRLEVQASQHAMRRFSQRLAPFRTRRRFPSSATV